MGVRCESIKVWTHQICEMRCLFSVRCSHKRVHSNEKSAKLRKFLIVSIFFGMRLTTQLTLSTLDRPPELKIMNMSLSWVHWFREALRENKTWFPPKIESLRTINEIRFGELLSCDSESGVVNPWRCCLEPSGDNIMIPIIMKIWRWWWLYNNNDDDEYDAGCGNVIITPRTIIGMIDGSLRTAPTRRNSRQFANFAH